MEGRGCWVSGRDFGHGLEGATQGIPRPGMNETGCPSHSSGSGPALVGLCPERRPAPKTLPRFPRTTRPLASPPAWPHSLLQNLLETARPALPPVAPPPAPRAPVPLRADGPPGSAPSTPPGNVSLGRPHYGAPRGQMALRVQSACAARPGAGQPLSAVQCPGGRWAKARQDLGPRSREAEVRALGPCPGPHARRERSFRLLKAGAASPGRRRVPAERRGLLREPGNYPKAGTTDSGRGR